MERKDGKLAIAIVAMFVVALSIVGVTYAYFVATVQGNTNENEKVDVQAGILEVTYTTSNILKATNVVPGWASDGKMIYHPVESDKNKDGHITAISIDDTVDNTYDSTAVKPATFSVQNTGDDTNDAKYAIKLTEITNGLYSDTNAEGKRNLTVSLYKGTWSDATGIASGTLVKTVELAESGEQVISGVYTTNGTQKDDFYVVVNYADDGAEQDSSNIKTVSVKVKVVGLHETEDGYVDAAGNAFTPAV